MSPPPASIDLSHFDLESGVRVTCDVGYLCANFSLPRPLCSRLRPDIRNRRQTSDIRQTDVRQHHRLTPPPITGGDILITKAGECASCLYRDLSYLEMLVCLSVLLLYMFDLFSNTTALFGRLVWRKISTSLKKCSGDSQNVCTDFNIPHRERLAKLELYTLNFVVSILI